MRTAADSPLDDSTPIRLGTGRWIVGIIVGGAVAVTVGHLRMESQAKELDSARVERKEIQAKQASLELQQQRTADALQVLVEGVKRIDARTERMERGDVRPARGHQ